MASNLKTEVLQKEMVKKLQELVALGVDDLKLVMPAEGLKGFIEGKSIRAERYPRVKPTQSKTLAPGGQQEMFRECACPGCSEVFSVGTGPLGGGGMNKVYCGHVCQDYAKQARRPKRV